MGEYLTKYYRFFFAICMVAIVGLAFYVGILEGERRGGEHVVLSCSDKVLESLAIPTTLGAEEKFTQSTKIDSATVSASRGAFAGSKNGTKYYTPDCAGLKRIKPENLIWFQTVEDATLQGYTPAQC